MAFVNRSARNLNAAPSSEATPPNLGPGSYQKPSTIHKSRLALAPFSSSADRGMDENFFAHGERGPGPGEYLAHKPVEIPGPMNTVNCSFVSKVPRFSDRKSVTELGPGHYIGIESTLKLKRKKIVAGKQKSPAKEISNDPTKVTAPSIPARHQSFGYEESSSGDLIPIPPPEVDPPSEVRISPPSAIDLTRGPKWAKSKSSRFQSSKDGFPGPGSFNPPIIEKKKTSPFVDSKPGSSFLSQTNRITVGGMNLSGIAAETPGPGK